MLVSHPASCCSGIGVANVIEGWRVKTGWKSPQSGDVLCMGIALSQQQQQQQQQWTVGPLMYISPCRSSGP